MIPNNNFSILPWYTSIEQQNARRWWIYDRIYPLYVPAGYIPPFQIQQNYSSSNSMTECILYNAKTDEVVDSSVASKLTGTGFQFKSSVSYNYSIAVYPGLIPAFVALANGQYYMRIRINNIYYYSEVFTVVNDISNYLKLTWWDREDLNMDAGTIVYTNPAYKNFLYLDSDIAKPEYQFEEEGDTRDGYFYPTKQISDKRYKFNFLASEYLLDVLRFARLADYATIAKRGQVYSLDSFLFTPDWESNGDVAKVEAEFHTATVVKKIGVGYIKALRGDYNDDFNNDYNNE